MGPLINSHATPDSIASSKFNKRLMKCGVGAEATALVLMLLSSVLSMMISFFIIRLYVMRIKGQKENLTEERLKIETLKEYEDERRAKKNKKKNKLEHQETFYHDATERSFGSNPNLRGSQHSLHQSSPKSSIPFAGAQ